MSAFVLTTKETETMRKEAWLHLFDWLICVNVVFFVVLGCQRVFTSLTSMKGVVTQSNT